MTMIADYILIFTALACVLIQLCGWMWQMKTKNADIVDICWCLSIVFCSIIYFLFRPANGTTTWLILVFPALWYTRLSYHLISRYSVEHEDNRYKNLRSRWSDHTQVKFLLFFLFQAALGWLFALPAYFISHSTQPIGTLAVLALLIGICSLIGASVADKQLHQFKKNSSNAKKVCDKGLWKYSRHPNYFFEWTHWFVYPILAWGTPYFYWSLLFPALMLLFLLKLTGIPFSEQQALKNRGEAYKRYQKKTNKFFLWKPKDA